MREASANIHLIVLDPGHFHAALLQKQMITDISPTVYVYAPEGPDLEAYLNLIAGFNQRPCNPTKWETHVYRGPDFLTRMTQDKVGNLVIIAGKHSQRMNYILASVEAGLNVLADKPMTITQGDFARLLKAFELAEEKKTHLYDIMTERYSVNNIILREYTQDPDVFGSLEKGTPEDPSVIMESTHHIQKTVDGKPLIRPEWFFDPHRQGGSMADVGTHLVDLAQWICFPNQTIDWRRDIEITSSKSWPTKLTLDQFKVITGLHQIPDTLREYVTQNDQLEINLNSEVTYTLHGIHCRLRTLWNIEAKQDSGDFSQSTIKGSKSSISLKQGIEQNWGQGIFVERAASIPEAGYEKKLRVTISRLSNMFPGLEVRPIDGTWEIIVPRELEESHEDHFAKVIRKYIGFLKGEETPDWEIPNMIAKYYTTTKAAHYYPNARAI